MRQTETETLGQAVARVRKNNGLTHTARASAVAAIVGGTQGRLSRLERGRGVPGAGQFEHLIAALKSTEEQARTLRDAASKEAERRARVA